MKITDIVFKSYEEVQEMPRFDLSIPPKKAKWYLQLLAWTLSFAEPIICKNKVTKTNMKDLKGGYILLCNHNSFVDFKVATKAIFPKRANYIVAIDGFIGRENIMRNVGCIGTRKFVSDSSIYRQIKYSLETLGIVCEIYPEARYSLTGTSAILPDSLGKMVKKLGYPVVSLISHGHHLRQPVWNLEPRKVKTKSDLTQILTSEDLEKLSVKEINQIIKDSFTYDDYKYQLEEKISIEKKNRAENLHKILYMCPHCEEEFTMRSHDHVLECSSCNETYEMNEFGQLENLKGDSKFTHIPDWFEWQREQVKKQIIDNKYNVELEVDIDSLPNSDGYYRLGKGILKHNKDGFTLTSKEFSINKSVKSIYGVHLEYDYFGRGDGLSFSTFKDTYYLYPTDQTYAVTKFHFAVEELYKLQKK